MPLKGCFIISVGKFRPEGDSIKASAVFISERSVRTALEEIISQTD